MMIHVHRGKGAKDRYVPLPDATLKIRRRRWVTHRNPRLIFSASAEAIQKLAADGKYIGADLPGFFGVHGTWGRTLEYHPHSHYIAPGGAFSTRDGLPGTLHGSASTCR